MYELIYVHCHNKEYLLDIEKGGKMELSYSIKPQLRMIISHNRKLLKFKGFQIIFESVNHKESFALFGSSCTVVVSFLPRKSHRFYVI